MDCRFIHSEVVCYRSPICNCSRILFARGQHDFLSANLNWSRMFGEFVVEVNICPDKKGRKP